MGSTWPSTRTRSSFRWPGRGRFSASRTRATDSSADCSPAGRKCRRRRTRPGGGASTSRSRRGAFRFDRWVLRTDDRALIGEDGVVVPIGDAEFRQRDVEAGAGGGAARGVGNRHRFRGKQHALERLRRGDVGLRRALLHRQCDGDGGERRFAGGNHAAARQHIVERRLHYRDIENFAALDLLARAVARTDGDGDAVAAGTLEGRHQFVERRANAAGSDQGDFVGARDAGVQREQRRDQREQAMHGSLLPERCARPDGRAQPQLTRPRYTPQVAASSSRRACAAASRATGTRGPEHDT